MIQYSLTESALSPFQAEPTQANWRRSRNGKARPAKGLEAKSGARCRLPNRASLISNSRNGPAQRYIPSLVISYDTHKTIALDSGFHLAFLYSHIKMTIDIRRIP